MERLLGPEVPDGPSRSSQPGRVPSRPVAHRTSSGVQATPPSCPSIIVRGVGWIAGLRRQPRASSAAGSRPRASSASGRPIRPDAVLRLSPIEALLADAVLAADIVGPAASLLIAQHTDDLHLNEPALLHVCLLRDDGLSFKSGDQEGGSQRSEGRFQAVLRS